MSKLPNTSSSSSSASSPPAQPPSPQPRPESRTIWGETVEDLYGWLRDGDDPEVIAHLEAENSYADSILAPTRELQETLFQEIKGRVKETDLSVPIVKDGWSYYSRSEEGKQYGIHCRKRVGQGLQVDHAYLDETMADVEQIFFDENAVAADTEYFDIGVFEVSPDHRLLLWGEDRSGEERFDIRIRDLASNTDLDDLLPGCSAGSAWATDNVTFFYLRLDEAHRPYQVWRHRLGTDATEDVMVFEEADERFWCGVGRERDDSFIHIASSSTLSDEVWLIPADEPTAQPFCVQPRTEGLEYGLSHHQDRFIVLTNHEAQNFKLMAVPVGIAGTAEADGAVPGSLTLQHWQPLIPHRADVMLTGFEILDDYLILFERAEGLTRFSFAPWSALGNDPEANLVAFQVVEQPEPVYAVWPGANPSTNTSLFRFGYTSMVTPSSLFTIDLSTGERVLLKQQEVLGDFDSSRYRTWREWATSADGTQVPLSLVARIDRAELLAHDDVGPAVLGAYGAYEISQDPGFSVARLSLLDRGFVVCLVHARGGGELGRAWYEAGKFEYKANTFLDVIAAGEHLVAESIASAEQLTLRGGSAGGLMAGAVMNMAPELFSTVVAQVPFVDIINTMLDTTLPLTVTEWEEWGDPATSEQIYQAMRAYAPLENVGPADYPAVYATAGLHDPRVGFWEPAKWVLALRNSTLGTQPIILRTEMGAGHGGPTGRYEEWRDEARTLAFILQMTAPGAPKLGQ